jgi:hypothetical protein
MLILPKLNKGIKQAMTKIERTGKVIVGAAMVVGLLMTADPSNEAQAAISSPTTASFTQGSMVLTPSNDTNTMIAQHYSHSSHVSHASHSSHYSHYSSRY